MASRKPGSPKSALRSARVVLRELEALRDTLSRSRPRTPGKRGAKTRALNALARRIPAARDRVTRAKKAIAAARTHETRSAAAKRRETTRKARSAARSASARKAAQTRWAKPAAGADHRRRRGRAMRFLFYERGKLSQGVVDPPSESDRSEVGRYWHAIALYRDVRFSQTPTIGTLQHFEGRTIFDGLRDTNVPFITDTALLDEAIARGFTDFDDLYVESTWLSAA